MKSIFLLISFFTLLNAQDAKKITTELNLYAGTKASVQWERIFSSERRMKKYNLDKLPLEQQIAVKSYLIEHAADSKQPIIPGL